jgi:hypothetical protein
MVIMANIIKTVLIFHKIAGNSYKVAKSPVLTIQDKVLLNLYQCFKEQFFTDAYAYRKEDVKVLIRYDLYW